MTLLGKIFVMFNLAISILMAVAAFELYATNLDYDSETKDKSGQPKPPARFTVVLEQLKEVQKTKAPVEGSWRTASTALEQRQEHRREARAWYDKQMVHERTLAKVPDDPVRMVTLVNHLPVPDKANKNWLQMEPAKDRADQLMPSLAASLARWEVIHKDNLNVLDKLRKEIANDIRLTHQLTGTTDPMDEESKKEKVTSSVWRLGYRQLLVDERIKREGVQSEINSVRPLFINTRVESELVRKRFEAMKERIEELKTYLKKKHKVDVAMRPR